MNPFNILNKKIIISFFFIFLFFILIKPARAGGPVITVGDNEVVHYSLKITPGFGSLLTFPEDIREMVNSDQTSFQCSQVQTVHLVCKALTDKKFSSNLIVTTDSNKFIINLSIDDVLSENPTDYTFDNPSIKKKAVTTSNDKSDEKNGDLLASLMDDFLYQPCSDMMTNAYAELKCLAKIHIGTDDYIRFKVRSLSRSPFNILKCDVVLQTLGGFTGLTLKEESPQNTDQIIKNKSLRLGEETVGIIRIPRVNMKEDQRIVLNVQTDIGKDADLYLKKIK